MTDKINLTPNQNVGGKYVDDSVIARENTCLKNQRMLRMISKRFVIPPEIEHLGEKRIKEIVAKVQQMTTTQYAEALQDPNLFS